MHQPILVTHLTSTPPPVITPPASVTPSVMLLTITMTMTMKPETSTSDKPSVVHQPTMMKTKTMKPETKTKKKIIKPPPVSTPEPNIEMITMEQCKKFITSEMDIF